MKKLLFKIILIVFILSNCKYYAHSNNNFKNIILRKITIANGFDFPVGPPDAKGYYNAQKFGRYNDQFNGYHLGEDWNGKGGGNSDLGDPVYSVSHGYVFYAEKAGPGWGNVIRIIHKIRTKSGYQYIESLYAHLKNVFVKKGDLVTRGQKIGTIGNANGMWVSHLHFEMRFKLLPIGGGYAKKIPEGFLNPTKFIKKHRQK